MDSEKILFCYRDDSIKKAVLFYTKDSGSLMAAIPCYRRFVGKNYAMRPAKVKKSIAEIYEKSGAGYLWLEEDLCDFLQMERMDFPDILVEKWLEDIPFFHTLVFADDKKGRAMHFLEERVNNLAAVCVVCFEGYAPEYEELAERLFFKEGIVLQVLTYEMLEKRQNVFEQEGLFKGRVAVLDFADKRSFWDKRLLKDMGYYSFWKEMRLFLDTFRKNRYNTLTK